MLTSDLLATNYRMQEVSIPAVIYFSVVMGVILSQVTVLTMWAAMGRSPVMRRTIIALAGSSFLGLALCVSLGEIEAEWFFVVWILTLVIAAAFVVLRWFQFQMVNTRLRVNLPMQFSPPATA